jgi:hypothetical protein
MLILAIKLSKIKNVMVDYCIIEIIAPYRGINTRFIISIITYHLFKKD